jgi:NAD(P)-dependent dehydrogenase (short-subunit alcohol dehydrogenase family)
LDRRDLGTSTVIQRRLERTCVMRLRALQDQVVMITGASSRIGLVTARRAARKGVTVVLGARAASAHPIRTTVGTVPCAALALAVVAFSPTRRG